MKSLNWSYVPEFIDRIEKYGEIDSTQKRIREIFDNKPLETVVLSDSQTEGFGRRKSSWESPSGGIYFSILVKRMNNTQTIQSVSIALAILRALEKQSISMDWKWPNDIIYKDKKFGGILLEGFSTEWMGIGIGLNTAAKKDKYPEYIRDEVSVCHVDENKLLMEIISNIKEYLNKEKFEQKEVEFLNKRLAIHKEKVRIANTQGAVIGVEDTGNLIIKEGKKERKVDWGRVVSVKKQVVPKKTIVAVDVGNTMTKIGKILPDGKIISKSINTYPRHKFLDRVKRITKDLFDKKDRPKGAALSCVVGPLEEDISNFLKSFVRGKTVTVNEKNTGNLRIKIKRPSILGPDRICNAAGAYNSYRGNMVIVDLGTANTFDIISKDGEYIGGIIAPGIEAMKDALIRRADKLKNYEFKKPSKIIGDSTISSMRSGLYVTLNGQIKNTIKHIKNEWKRDFKVIITGGGLEQVSTDIIEEYTIDKDITLKGLCFIYLGQKLT
ncbi:MAG: biotin--[acetyl-CoA-carboxylase] ligase [Elusimicrobiota bacterium]